MKKLIKKIFKREKKEDTPELKRKKTIMFFGFYLVFFLFPFIWMKSYGSNPRNEEIKEDTEITYKTDMIENNNYTYVFEIEEDNNNEISYKYEIDSKTLSNMLQDGKTVENGINNIIVYVDSTNNAYKIELDFSNYMRSIEEYTKYHLTLYYGMGE